MIIETPDDIRIFVRDYAEGVSTSIEISKKKIKNILLEIEKLVEKLEREGTDARLIRKYLKRVKQRASAKRSMR